MGSKCMLVIDASVGISIGVVVGIGTPIVPKSSRFDTQKGDDVMRIIRPSWECRLLRRNLLVTGTKQHDVVVILAGAAALYVLSALAAHLAHIMTIKFKMVESELANGGSRTPRLTLLLLVVLETGTG
jgi:hypothetical protein